MPRQPNERAVGRRWLGRAAGRTVECAACGRQAPLDSNPVPAVSGLRVICGGCGAVLVQVISSPHSTWLDTRGMLTIPFAVPGASKWGDA
jgi:hypothetical protein